MICKGTNPDGTKCSAEATILSGPYAGMCRRCGGREYWRARHGQSRKHPAKPAAPAASTALARLEKANGAPLREIPRKWKKDGKPVAGGASAVATLCVSEEQLDRFLTQILTIEEKAEIVGQFLR
jgi:hypothetical protein